MDDLQITRMRVRDIRFPTSRERDGSDALNLGDYSATYVTLETRSGLVGHGLTFTNGRGNELCVGGVNEVLAVLLMAAKYGVRVCPHAGGVGLCEYVPHLAIFDYVAVSGSLEDRLCEYVDHLHEHFVDPFPGGRVWRVA